MAFDRLIDQYLYQRFFAITSDYDAAADVPVPEEDTVRLYARASSGTYQLFYKDDQDFEHDLSGSASSFTIGTTTATSGTVGSVLFVGTGPVVAQDNANLFWDDTNNRLGIGTATPSYKLHLTGNNADTRVLLLSGGAAKASMYMFGRTGIDAGLGVAGAAGEFSNISTQAGDTVLTAETFDLILAARTAAGLIKFSNGAVDSVKFQVGAAGQWGIGGATYGTSGNVFTSAGASAAPTWTAPAGGANFGPGLPTSVTVVNGHVTAIS